MPGSECKSQKIPPTRAAKNSFYVAFLLAALGTSPSAAEVLDLEKGQYTTRKVVSRGVVQGVLDLDRPPQPEAPEDDAKATEEATRIAIRRPKSLPQGKADIEELIVQVGLDYVQHPGIRAAGITPTEWLSLFRANIAVESNFNPSAISPVGAIGLGQLMPDTAAVLGVDPYDIEENLHGSARYLLKQMNTFGSIELALAAYNAGPEAVNRYGGIPPYRETEGHVQKVLSIFEAVVSKETSL